MNLASLSIEEIIPVKSLKSKNFAYRQNIQIHLISILTAAVIGVRFGPCRGGVAEWSNATVLKTVVG